MKNLVIILSILFNNSCNAQIHEELKGCWLPEKYVLAIIANDTSIADKFLFPVEGFEILKENTIEFLKYYSENENKDADRIVLILTYKSEMNTVLTEEAIHGGTKKYKLPFFSSYLNLGYIPPETVERYKKANIYLSKVGDKLLLEIVEKDKKEEIYFLDRIKGYEFKSISEAKMYLQEK